MTGVWWPMAPTSSASPFVEVLVALIVREGGQQIATWTPVYCGVGMNNLVSATHQQVLTTTRFVLSCPA